MRPKGNRRFNRSQTKRSLGCGVKWMLSVGFFLALIALGGYFWWNFSHQPIRGVEIISDGQAVSVAKLESMVKERVSGDFYTLNTRQLRTKLELLPWVKSVAIRRVWPDKLKIEIHEYEAIALWNETELLSQEGTLFQPPFSTFPAGLPRLGGPDEEQKKVLAQYLSLSHQLEPLHLQLTSLSLEDHSWHFQLDSGAQVYFNEGEEQQLQGFKKLYEQMLHDKMMSVEKVDLRYAGGAAVRWKTKQITEQ